MKARALIASLAVTLGATFVAPSKLLAHCDSLDGPVVKAAQAALDTRDVTRVLIWVAADDEPAIRTALEKTLAVRDMGPRAKELADGYFFETVVRIHRAGEGAPYTGLKPAGRDIGPAIPAADKSLREASIEPVAGLLEKAMDEGLRRHFEEAVTTKNFKSGDVNAGREHIKAYVEFIHYVERLYEAIATSAHGHFTEPANTDNRH
jgi:hypothetical protein